MITNKIVFNSQNSNTDLCKLGAFFEADKSPYNPGKWRHGYTPFYDLLFSQMRYENINIGEIGIFKNASIQMWRTYFQNANIYAWDHDNDLLEYAKTQNLKNVYYDKMDVCSEQSINECLEKTGVKFDILIDDASHEFWDQIKVIRNAYMYLKPGGYLIIEDIDRWRDESDYSNEIWAYNHMIYFSHMSFVETEHNNKMTYPFDNDKLLVLVRNNLEDQKS
jgi:SAM-dependent methyltransferase